MLGQNHRKKLHFIGDGELVINELSRREIRLCSGKFILRVMLDCLIHFNVINNKCHRPGE